MIGSDGDGELGDLFADRALDIALFIRHERFGKHLPAVTVRSLLQRRAAEIVVETFGGAVRNGDDADLELHERDTWRVKRDCG